MPRRSSPRGVEDIGDLTDLGMLVVDKRLGQRSAAKKNRRNRHDEKQFIRHALSQGLAREPRGCPGDAEVEAAADRVALPQQEESGAARP